MSPAMNIRLYNAIAFILAIIVLMYCPATIYAASHGHPKAPAPADRVNVPVGKSIIFETPQPVKRVAIAQPAIADAMVLTPRQIYINGKSPGSTNVTLWGSGDTITGILDIDVAPDSNRLKEHIYTLFPGEKAVAITSANDYLTLSGTVTSLAAANQIFELARAYAPVDKDGRPRIINVMEVGGIHQVMLEIKVSEMSRTLGRELGVNFNLLGRGGSEGNIFFLNNFPISATATSTGSILANYIRGDVTWNILLEALKEDGLIKVLAEPTLITLSGKEARFLAGGEFPVPVPQNSGGGTTITIEYKPFGVGLAFTPVVLGNGKINMQVAPEVSDLDFTTAVAINGYVIPSITTRRVATTVELADGQSFAIAGLLKESAREVIRKFPLLGEIPILGTLFRSSSFQKQDTELVIIVTPHLVKPVDRNKQTAPTDQFVEPNDFEFYLLGRTEGSGEPKRAGDRYNPRTRSQVNTDDKLGHVLPD
jgi:pilus assembly protein CpaC